ncbi:hypothetical protein [Nocardioides sp. MH1]|uniref:hypothetical protein n=1 Tax=Nocardioides sp. MH1 TaxID=3242490 RepID=UPI0035200F31
MRRLPRGAAVLSLLVVAAAGCRDTGPADPVAGPALAPSDRELRQAMTRSTDAEVGWAHCGRRAPESPSTRVGQFTGDADFFEGGITVGTSFVPEGATSLAICSIGAQGDDVWLVDGAVMLEVLDSLNGASSEIGEGGCTADYGIPQRIVFRYRGGEVAPVSWSASGCGYAWNGTVEHVGLKLLVSRVQEAMSRLG